MTSTTSAPGSPQEAVEVRTENLFQRTEVLAGMYQHTSDLVPEKTRYMKEDRTDRWTSSCFSPLHHHFRRLLCSEIHVHPSMDYWQTSKTWECWNIFSLLFPI